MYTPTHFRFENETDKVNFMKRYSFGTIITVKDDLPIATQLPFFIDDSSDRLKLISHFAVANEQAKYIEDKPSLIIFSEPHAYISPTHYDKRESVPTWDYISVHAYGTAKIITEEPLKLEALEQMIRFYEKSYMQQWQDLPEKFKTGMMRGIIAFELEITDLQGQKKLSQNKTEIEIQRITDHLENSDNTVEKELVEFMKNTKK
ncbi:FMN-binding negative transcriptional regulator [Sphingobacterium sp.]|uniref:FMN-binding negative transcriptional regulator n=1 Tax=Sphingobacterium sp. TaxID=341027 RepID=UPI00289A6583|nr:FMN-binding negative transcriptional regulator [Sphingobacterium sp.]